MRRPALAALACLALLAADEPAFDGKSLAGWEHLPAHWKASAGAITGTTNGSLKTNPFLCSRKAFKDFELSFKVRLKDGQGNSGVQIRSEVLDREKPSVK